MNDLQIAGSQTTPTITSDSQKGLLCMRGESYPENAFALYSPVFHWLEQYFSTPEQALRLELELVYLNTSSIKALMDIFDMLEAAYNDGHDISVVWYYDANNDRVGELATEFREDFSFAFDIVSR